MKTRKIVIRAVVVVIGLPVVLVLVAVVSFYLSFYALNRANGTIVSSGQKREYLLYVPRSYDRTKPTPLVISMHAAALWPATQMETSQWNTTSGSMRRGDRHTALERHRGTISRARSSSRLMQSVLQAVARSTSEELHERSTVD